MKLRSIHIDKRFVPVFAENKDLPASDQVVIHFSRIPGTSEKMNYKGWKQDQSGAIQLSYNDSLLVATFVERVENLEIDVNGKIKRIKNGTDLASANNPALSELFAEIRDYLFPDNEDIPEGESDA